MTKLAAWALMAAGCVGDAGATSVEPCDPGVELGLHRGELERHPEDHLAWYWFGAALSDQGKHAEAVEAYERAVALAANEPAFLQELGFARYRAGDLAAAAQALTQAIAIEPRLDEAHRQLGEIHARRGEPARAAAAFATAISAAPRRSEGYVALGELYADLGYAEEALEVLERGRVTAEHVSPGLWLALGRARADRGDLAGASEALSEVRAVGEAPYERGLLHHAQGDLDAARRELATFVTFRGVDPLSLDVARKLLHAIDAEKHP